MNPITCILRDKIVVANDTVTLHFETVGEKMFSFEPGQYVVVAIQKEGFNDREGKMYTISSAPNLLTFDITIRKIGVFSGALHDLSVNDLVTISGPYGNLCPRKDLEEAVFIAGGIGVTPFYSMIQQYLREPNDRPKHVVVVYSNKTHADAAFLKELNSFTAEWDGLEVVNAFTREDAVGEHEWKGRINGDIIRKSVKNLLEPEYFICGSLDFSDSMWQMLKGLGVSEGQIHIETFY